MDIEIEPERYRLTIPVDEALAFALGDSNLDYRDPKDELRRVVGVLAVDSLEYSEEWRAATEARAALQRRWPGHFRS